MTTTAAAPAKKMAKDMRDVVEQAKKIVGSDVVRVTKPGAQKTVTRSDTRKTTTTTASPTKRATRNSKTRSGSPLTRRRKQQGSKTPRNSVVEEKSDSEDKSDSESEYKSESEAEETIHKSDSEPEKRTTKETTTTTSKDDATKENNTAQPDAVEDLDHYYSSEHENMVTTITEAAAPVEPDSEVRDRTSNSATGTTVSTASDPQPALKDVASNPTTTTDAAAAANNTVTFDLTDPTADMLDNSSVRSTTTTTAAAATSKTTTTAAAPQTTATTATATTTTATTTTTTVASKAAAATTGATTSPPLAKNSGGTSPSPLPSSDPVIPTIDAWNIGAAMFNMAAQYVDAKSAPSANIQGSPEIFEWSITNEADGKKSYTNERACDPRVLSIPDSKLPHRICTSCAAVLIKIPFMANRKALKELSEKHQCLFIIQAIEEQKSLAHEIELKRRRLAELDAARNAALADLAKAELQQREIGVKRLKFTK